METVTYSSLCYLKDVWILTDKYHVSSLYVILLLAIFGFDLVMDDCHSDYIRKIERKKQYCYHGGLTPLQ
jgi:hypothetical protein